jgi:hypothetical protein
MASLDISGLFQQIPRILTRTGGAKRPACSLDLRRVQNVRLRYALARQPSSSILSAKFRAGLPAVATRLSLQVNRPPALRFGAAAFILDSLGEGWWTLQDSNL